jgi:hypothetical protein
MLATARTNEGGAQHVLLVAADAAVPQARADGVEAPTVEAIDRWTGSSSWQCHTRVCLSAYVSSRICDCAGAQFGAVLCWLWLVGVRACSIKPPRQ